MATATQLCIIVLLLYSQRSYGQPMSSNQNIGINNFNGLQQRNLHRTPRNFNSVLNGPVNFPPPPNLQQSNPQISTVITNQENLQPQMNLPPNLQYQSFAPQNSFQITKLGFTPVTPQIVNNPATSPLPLQNPGFQTNLPINTPITQIANSPMTESNLADLAAFKGQSLLSLLNSQNNCQFQQNPQTVFNSQSQLTDYQKQPFVTSFQGQTQPGMNVNPTQPIVVSMDNLQPVTVSAINQPQGQALVTPLGAQPAYITVQAQPLTTYLQNQMPQVIIEEEPSIASLILSELGPQYGIDTGCSSGSKSDFKSLIPLIVSLLKEKGNCGCRRCGCSNCCQNKDYSKNLIPELPAAQIIEGYSKQKDYSQGLDDLVVQFTKNDEDVNQADEKKIVNFEPLDTEEDDSEYSDDD